MVCLFMAADHGTTAAQAETQVAIELLLALDASASMDRDEFALQVKGLEQAFRDPQVRQAVQDLQPLGVAVGVVQWGGPEDHAEIVPFVKLDTGQDSAAFGFRIGLAQRAFSAAQTSITTAITRGVSMLDSNEFDGQRRVIDISGDGEDNSGLNLNAARKAARASLVTINGLAIEAEEKGLAAYYDSHVRTGADSFVIRANGFEDYARAIKEKLLRELRPLGS